MTTSLALLILAAALSTWLAARGIGDHRKARAARHGLLDEAKGLLVGAEQVIGPDAQHRRLRWAAAAGRP